MGPMQTTLQLVADLARVAVALPVFAYASYRDVLERRVEHKTWIPLVVVGVAALAVDLYNVYTTGAGFRRVAIVGGLSLGIGLVFGYGFYYIGAFGGADRYAVLVLALLFP
ncbi:MAG: prepilin peptidase, partial [Halobacteria archaeon]|nr:prepilin peptidase [Halobacteria archaeon]